MIARKNKFLSAAVVAVALLATVAVARTVHTRAVGAQATTGSVTGASAGQTTTSPLHGSIACPYTNVADCEKLETWLPE